ncbi:hypothetical protein O0L34_g8380 [Tuta absoluta]|nr:hypothetical protein O0L34_g8380 [Tuta absoluta]
MYHLNLFLFIVVLLKFSLQSGPITLKISPDVTVFEGTGNLICYASGSNLRNIQPYELVWLEQGDGGIDGTIVKELNAESIVLDQKILEQHNSQFVFCALIFKFISPNQFWQVKSKYISISIPDFIDTPLRKLGNKTSDQISSLMQQEITDKVVIESVTVVVGLLVIIITGTLLYRRFCKKDRAPPIDEDNLSVTRSQDNIYTYVPLQKIPFEEAKKIVAANTKTLPEFVKPPPLPSRPKHHKYIEEEQEYSYTYGIKN